MPAARNDPDHVARQYADERQLLRRAAFRTGRTGPQPHQLALERIRAARPSRVLEVRCGPGAFAAALASDGDIDDIAATRFADHLDELPPLPDGLGVTARNAVFVATR